LLSKIVQIKAYRTTILPVGLYGCETWSLTLLEEHRLRMFENRLPRRDEVTTELRGLHKEKLYDLYLSPNIICFIKSRRIRRVENVARGGEERCI
jgi:hypothetical protein